uniref:Thyrotropin-releasing hormone receptor n=1 Tax=Caenorhabditis japonica TaxID=281687 RepID=A0A8R1DLL1_CAEJA
MNATFLEEDPCAESFIDQDFVRYPLMTIYITVFVVCLIGNLVTILVITTHPQMRTPTNFFLANLAAADLLVAIFCILQNMIHLVGFDHGVWPLGDIMCKLYLCLTNIMPCTSAGILVLVSVEKYIAVLHPLSGLSLLTKENRYRACFGVWFLSVTINFPFFLNAKYYEYGGIGACYRESQPLWNTFCFVVWYMIPLISLVFIYSRISHLLWTSESNRQSTRQSAESIGSQGTGTGTGTGNGNGIVTAASWQLKNGKTIIYKQESLLHVPICPRDKDEKPPRRSKDNEGRRKVVRLLVAVVVSFAVLTFPHHARLLFTSFNTGTICNSHWAMLVQPLSYILLFISSAINPILYACLSKRFRKAMSDLLHCRKGVFFKIARSRNRTMISDLPLDDSRCPSPLPMIRMNKLRGVAN